MSLFDYEQGRDIAMQDHPFYALIQAAMRQADTENYIKLRAEFPEVEEELRARYVAPNGKLPNEIEHNCSEGWVCEQHPDWPWPHARASGARCGGSGMPCPHPDCTMSMSRGTN